MARSLALMARLACKRVCLEIGERKVDFIFVHMQCFYIFELILDGRIGSELNGYLQSLFLRSGSHIFNAHLLHTLPFTISSYLKTAPSSTCAPRPQSSSLQNSLGLWLIPSFVGVK